MYIEKLLVNEGIATPDKSLGVFDTGPIAASLASNPDAVFYLKTLNISASGSFTIRFDAVLNWQTPDETAFNLGNTGAITSNGTGFTTINKCPRFIELFSDTVGATTADIRIWVVR